MPPKREENMAKMEKVSSSNSKFGTDDQMRMGLKSAKTEKVYNPGLQSKDNLSRAVGYVEKCNERGKDAPMVGGMKNDDTTH